MRSCVLALAAPEHLPPLYFLPSDTPSTSRIPLLGNSYIDTRHILIVWLALLIMRVTTTQGLHDPTKFLFQFQILLLAIRFFILVFARPYVPTCFTKLNDHIFRFYRPVTTRNRSRKCYENQWRIPCGASDAPSSPHLALGSAKGFPLI